MVVGGVALSVLARRLSDGARQNLLAFCLSVLVALLIVDTTYAVWVNAQADRRATEADERLDDRHVWHGELIPRSYYPTDGFFMLYKPNVRVEAETYGEFYERRMFTSPTLVRDALRLRPLVYTIDEHGLRNRVSIRDSRLWALGDSFAMGYATSEGFTWTDRLGELTGQSVYALGISGTSPGQQMQILEHLLRAEQDAAKPAHLLWMVFEGNDLENSYAERRPVRAAPSRFRALAENTLMGDLLALPSTIRRRSAIRRLLASGWQVPVPATTSRQDPYEIEGVRLATPAYRSDRWGYCLLNPVHIEAAGQPEDYVLTHPNRPLLDRAFERMKVVADEFGFRVTVMVAPSTPRVYGPEFPEMPQPTAVPHFIRYVEQLAGRVGFETVDLLGPLRADTSDEMLYYCDDHHWNARGNDTVARILVDALGPRRN